VKFSAEQLAQKKDYHGNKCYLQLPGICTGGSDAMDHVKPLTKGGADMLANLRPICKNCNSSKGNKWPFDFKGAA
jgi:5-methylcytosine-specific restriction endonuclease McrA